MVAAGCQSHRPPEGAPATFRLNRATSVEITPADDDFDRRRSAVGPAARSSRGSANEFTEGELYELPKFTVRRTGFVKFGLSVVTNTEVAVGGPIAWMRVGVVLPGSPAARRGLSTGIEILAIDGTPVAQLSREEMLHRLFERESGEHVRLLVYSRQLGPLPYFVTL